MLKSIREKTNELHAIDEEIRQHRRSLLQLKDCFRELCARKKELVDKYNMERKEYSDWCTANKKKISCCYLYNYCLSYPATYPAAHGHNQGEVLRSLEVLALVFHAREDC